MSDKSITKVILELSYLNNLYSDFIFENDLQDIYAEWAEMRRERQMRSQAEVRMAKGDDCDCEEFGECEETE